MAQKGKASSKTTVRRIKATDDEPKKDAEFTQIKDGTTTAEKTETVKDKEQA